MLDVFHWSVKCKVSCNCFGWVEPLRKQRVRFGSNKTSLNAK